MQPADLVNLSRYPILDDTHKAREELLASCREQVHSTALCQLPNFLSAKGLEALAAESRGVAPKAVRRDSLRSAYGWMDNTGVPSDHPRAAQHHDRKGTVHYDLFPAGSLIQQLYEWKPLTKFIAETLEEPSFYTCADPVMSVVLSVMKPGDEHGWHFDTNDSAITLCLQASEGGGDFISSPFIRDEDDENFDAVGEIFNGNTSKLASVSFDAGTLTLFRGRRSLHRVAKITGNRDRLMAIFSYASVPGFVWPEKVIRMSKNLTM